MKNTEQNRNPGAPQGGRAKPYNSPRLVDFGTVAQLTRQFSNSALSDSGSNMMAPS